TTPCCARQAFTQCRWQPSMARIARPEAALLTSADTPPPTPAMHDISARPLRSRRTARVFASCATLEQPEHEYTRGRLAGRDIAGSSRVAGQYPSWPHSSVDDGQEGPVAWLRIAGRS